MKILQIFGAVVAVHLLAFIFIFASPGCQSGPRTMPTPDATMPSGGATAEPPVSYNTTVPQPVDLGTPSSTYTPAIPTGQATPTRPGSANAVAVTPPAKSTTTVAPVASYTVERGDSLWSIAKKHGITVGELARANSMSSGTALKPGRKLIVPVKPGAPSPDSVAAPASLANERPATGPRTANGEVVRHTVAAGESLGVIARKYQVSVGELAAANNITDPSRVRAGQQLIVPGYRGPVRNAPASTPRPPSSTPANTAASTPQPASPTPAPSTPPPVQTPAQTTAPQFDLTPPPPGQDLDAGLKPSETEVPTIRVEEPEPSKN